MPELEPVGKAGPNKSFNAFRAINTMEEALDAQRAATGIGVLIIIGYALYMLLNTLNAAPEGMREPVSNEFYVFNGVVLAVAALMTFWVWARRSLIGTVLLIVWYIIERVAVIQATPQAQFNFMGIVLVVVAGACAILAIRGHMAAARIRKQPPTDARVFE